MLPQDAIVFFVETDGIVDLEHLAPAVRHLGVEVVDVPQTINYHPQSGWFEDAPLKGGAVARSPLRRHRDQQPS
jgi:hypothetical protein